MSLAGMGFNSKCKFAPPTILLGLLLCPWAWGISSQPLQCLPSYWDFSDLGHGVSIQGRSSKTQAPLLTLDMGYLLSAAPVLYCRCVKRQKDRTPKDEFLRSVSTQYATGDQWRNNCRRNEEKKPKQKQHPVVDVTGD